MKRDHWKDVPERKRYSLDRNENCDSHLRKFIEDAFYRNLQDIHAVEYPNMSKAYECMSDLYACSVDNLYLTSGCEQGIKSILEVYSDSLLPNLTYFQPTFGMVPVYADYYEYACKAINYEYKHDRFIAPIPSEGDVVYVADPDNPTGADLGYSHTRQLCENFKVVILDRAYAPISEIVQTSSLMQDYSNLYILHSFSKLYAGAGLRIGCILSCKENIDNLYQARPMYELNSIACEYVDFVRSNYIEYLTSIVGLSKSKEYIESQLGMLAPVVGTTGNFVIVEKNDKIMALLNNNIGYKELYIDGHNFIRITVPDIDLAKRLFNVLELL
jgi:histidinol-phosphate/aromatic aminotransferase/cobyric acid decarboxylase-like protein